MRKVIFIPIYLGMTCLCSSAWSQGSSADVPEVEMRHHRHHHHHHSSSHRHHSSSNVGPRGPTGATGSTGAMGPTGTGSAISPSFGSFYSSTVQIVGPTGGAIFFENTNTVAVGPAFTFTPGVGPLGDTFDILQTGYYAISYGIWGADIGHRFEYASPIIFTGIALSLNATIVPGSEFYPIDTSSNLMMSAFSGIFHLSSTGTLQLINISDFPLYLTPPSVSRADVESTLNIPVETSAYINIQFLSPD